MVAAGNDWLWVECCQFKRRCGLSSWPADIADIERGTSRARKQAFVQAVGMVPPSITYSVPVMLGDRSDARNAIRLATSTGADGGPVGMPPSETMIRRLPFSTPAPSSAPSRLARSTDASVRIYTRD